MLQEINPSQSPWEADEAKQAEYGTDNLQDVDGCRPSESVPSRDNEDPWSRRRRSAPQNEWNHTSLVNVKTRLSHNILSEAIVSVRQGSGAESIAANQQQLFTHFDHVL